MAEVPLTSSQWQVVWLKAVATAWKDPKFEKELKADLRKALKKKFNFSLPDGANVYVAGGAPPPEGKHFCLTVHIPPKPSDDEQAVALASLADETARHCCGQPCC